MIHEVETGTEADCVDILHLMKSESNAVGFVPHPRVREELRRGNILVAKIGDEVVGYLLHSRSRSPLRVIQLVVMHSRRRRGIGRSLVEAAKRRISWREETILACREDLQANEFWKRLGFEEVGRCGGRTARRKEKIRYSSHRLKTVAKLP